MDETWKYINTNVNYCKIVKEDCEFIIICSWFLFSFSLSFSSFFWSDNSDIKLFDLDILFWRCFSYIICINLVNASFTFPSLFKFSFIDDVSIKFIPTLSAKSLPCSVVTSLSLPSFYKKKK